MFDAIDEVGFKKLLSCMWPCFLEDMLSTDAAQICGVVQIVDLATFSYSGTSKLKNDKDYVAYKRRESEMMAVGAMPMMIGAVYMLDAPWYFRWFWSFVSMFMRKEITALVHFTPVEAKALAKVRALFAEGTVLPPLLMYGDRAAKPASAEAEGAA